jgi:hypothetical protein
VLEVLRNSPWIRRPTILHQWGFDDVKYTNLVALSQIHSLLSPSRTILPLDNKNWNSKQTYPTKQHIRPSGINRVDDKILERYCSCPKQAPHKIVLCDLVITARRVDYPSELTEAVIEEPWDGYMSTRIVWLIVIMHMLPKPTRAKY